MSDEALTYLQGDSHGRKRDLITRCYYEVAQGDPKSGPVVFAVLLDAAAEQFAKTPQELLGVVTEFRKLLAEGREMEARIRERVELSNFGVVAEFKDETRRASDTLREIANLGSAIIDRAKRIDEKLKPVVANLERIGVDLYVLKDDLKENRESARRMMAAAENIQSLHQENQAFMRSQGKEARANWTTTGFLAGILMAAVSFHLPWWEGVMLLVAAVVLIQWLSRHSWDFVRRWIGSGKSSSVNSKPTG
jgi:hypothetical protein